MELVHMEWNRWRYFYKNFEQIFALKIPQDAWFILNDGTRGKEAAVRLGVPAEKIHFLPNGINVEWGDLEINRAALREAYQFPPGSCIILFLSRLVRSKRPEDLLRAIPAILERTEEKLLFVFAGDGPLRGECERRVNEQDLGDHVRFLGTVPHRDVPELMYASDLFVTTSNLTNMAIPTCEAFLCGLPVVAYDVGDTARVVRHGETGSLVPDGDVAGLADAIAGLCSDRETRLRLGQAAQAFAKIEFMSWDARTALEFDLLESLLKK
jgi:glycosyltransferase involved in cell wall biosynthesis